MKEEKHSYALFLKLKQEAEYNKIDTATLVLVQLARHLGFDIFADERAKIEKSTADHEVAEKAALEEKFPSENFAELYKQLCELAMANNREACSAYSDVHANLIKEMTLLMLAKVMTPADRIAWIEKLPAHPYAAQEALAREVMKKEISKFLVELNNLSSLMSFDASDQYYKLRDQFYDHLNRLRDDGKIDVHDLNELRKRAGEHPMGISHKAITENLQKLQKQEGTAKKELASKLINGELNDALHGFEEIEQRLRQHRIFVLEEKVHPESDLCVLKLKFDNDITTHLGVPGSMLSRGASLSAVIDFIIEGIAPFRKDHVGPEFHEGEE